MAHYYGLNPSLALASVTSTPADALGLGHRVGTIREGVLHIKPTKLSLTGTNAPRVTAVDTPVLQLYSARVGGI